VTETARPTRSARTRSALRRVQISHVLLACSILWIALGHGVLARAAHSGTVVAAPRCPSATPPRSIPLEKLTIENATDIAPIAGVGHVVLYRHKALTAGLQLNGSDASGTFLLNRHYKYLVGVAYEDDTSSPGGIIIKDASTGDTVYQYHFTSPHDRVPLNLDVHRFASITVQITASYPPATLNVVTHLTP
jgi:hypothetical protein